MKYSVKKSTLTALVCLALSSSALAMPAGGVVTDISGYTAVNGGVVTSIATIESGSVIKAMRNSIINWQSFGIAANESLTFNTEDGAILNRVTGGDITEIYGTLKQVGSPALFIVNPNGIIVGSDATINANHLILSTLDITDDSFKALDTGNSGFELSKVEGKSDASLVIKGTKNFTVDDYLILAGGKVNIDENVSITTKVENEENDSGYISIFAGNAMTENASRIANSQSTTENTVNINAASISGSDYVGIYGGKITISDGSTIDSRGMQINAANKVVTGAVVGSTHYFEATKDNAVKITDSTLTVNAPKEMGTSMLLVSAGSVAVGNSTIDGSQATALEISAFNKQENHGEQEYDAGNTKIKDDKTTITGTDYGGDWTIGEVKADEPSVTPGTGGDSGTGGDQGGDQGGSGTGGDKGNSGEQPSQPSQPDVPATPALDAKDETNIASGKQAMGELLEKNATTAGRVQAAGALVQNLNTADGTSRAKAGQVLGMLNNIESNQALGAPERNAMRHAILDNYAPVRSGEQLNESTRTAAHTEAELSTIERLVDTLVAAATSDDEAVVTVER